MIYDTISLTDVKQHACQQLWPQMRCCHWTGVFSCRHLGLSRAWLSHPSLSVFPGRVCWCLLSELFYMQRQIRGVFCLCLQRGSNHEKECVNYYSLNSRLREVLLTWWKPVNILWRMWQSATFQGRKQNKIFTITLSMNTTLRLLWEPCHVVCWSCWTAAM